MLSVQPTDRDAMISVRTFLAFPLMRSWLVTTPAPYRKTFSCTAVST